MKKIRVGILGPTGRMGRSLLKEKELFPTITITALCESKNHKDIGKEISGIRLTDDLNDLILDSEVIIDFSVPKATLALMRMLKKKKKKDICLITGTTGFSKQNLVEFRELSKGLRIMQSYNMSIGVNLLLSSVEFFSEKLGKNVDIEIIDSEGRLIKNVYDNQVMMPGTHQLQINIDDLTQGFYFLRISDNRNNVIISRFIK